MTNDEMLMQILEGQRIIQSDINSLKSDINSLKFGQDNLNKRLDEIEHETKITRNAVNHIGDKLEELVTVFNETNVVSMKY